MDVPRPEQHAAGWYVDPAGRHAYRWWDGSAWTPYAGAEAVVWDPFAEDSVTSPSPTAVLGVAITGFVLGVVASLVALRTILEDESVSVRLLGSSLALWAGLLGAWLVARRRTGERYLQFRWVDVWYGLAGSLVARVLAGVAITPVPFPDRRLRDLDEGVEVLSGAWPWIVLLAVTCVGAPLIEELFFRGVVQRRLVSWLGVVPGIVLASILFGAAHLLGWDGPLSLATAWAIAVSGAVLGVLYHLTGRLGTAIAAHAWFNAQAMLAIALLT